MKNFDSLMTIIHRNPAPEPWREGDNIPWHDPDFSERMLKEHLTQDHDLASRRFEKIDQHISWMHQEVFKGQTIKFLDLGCGPGLYASRLAHLGHQVTGIDYSPASIAYAEEQAAQQGLAITYIHADIREAAYGSSYDAVMLIFGEFNIFKPKDMGIILPKIHAALKPGGILILEPHTFDIIEKMGQSPPSWHASESGLFSPSPHIILTENFWDAEKKATTIRHYVIEATHGNVIRYAQSFQAYTNDEYKRLLTDFGFDDIQIYPSLMGKPDPQQEALIAITAQKA